MSKTTPRWAALLLAASMLFAACGGGDDPAGKERAREGACKDEVTVEATFLPAGFDRDLVKGPGGGKEEIEDAIVYHYAGSKDTQYIDIFRGSQRNKLKGTKYRMLGKTGRFGKIPGGYAAKVKLARGTCTRYQLEAFGVSEGDFKKVVNGLRRTPGAEDDEE